VRYKYNLSINAHHLAKPRWNLVLKRLQNPGEAWQNPENRLQNPATKTLREATPSLEYFINTWKPQINHYLAPCRAHHTHPTPPLLLSTQHNDRLSPRRVGVFLLVLATTALVVNADGSYGGKGKGKSKGQGQQREFATLMLDEVGRQKGKRVRGVMSVGEQRGSPVPS